MSIKAQPFDIMQYFYSIVQDPLIRCRIQFQGKLETDRLVSAINGLLCSNPIMNCTYHIKKRKWIEASFSIEAYLSIVKVDYELEAEQEVIESKYLMSSLRIGIDPPIKFFLIAGKYHDSICVVVSHLLCDGRGFEQLLYSFAQLYSANGKLGSLDTTIDRSFHQISHVLPLWKSSLYYVLKQRIPLIRKRISFQ